MNNLAVAVGDLIEVKTERLAYGGEAIARYQELAVFIQGGAPDELLRVRITERKKRYARAVIEEIITPSPFRREPPCKYFGQCGGCQLQHINYEAQLAAKIGFIRDALKRTGQIDWTDEIKIYSAAEFNYRLRAKIKIDRINFRGKDKNEISGKDKPPERNGQVRIGFNKANSHEVCDVEDCKVLLPELNEALPAIRANLNRNKQIIGYSGEEFEIAVSDLSIIDQQSKPPQFQVSVSPPNREFSVSDIQRTVAGAVYQFSSSSFFQANAFLLDEFVKEAVGVEKGEFALDLFAGVGFFTIPLAGNFKRVVGVESNPRSVEFAIQNIFLNDAKGTKVFCNRVDIWLKDFLNQANRQTPDLVLLDPPRSGAAEVVELLVKLQPSRIHYVSCDPLTLARDLKKLVASNFEIERIVAFDMFPQTFHVETIAYLKKI